VVGSDKWRPRFRIDGNDGEERAGIKVKGDEPTEGRKAERRSYLGGNI